MLTRALGLALFVPLSLSACSEPSFSIAAGSPDAEADQANHDSGVHDAAAHDAASHDAGGGDGGGGDAGRGDGTVAETGANDGAVHETGTTDSGTADSSSNCGTPSPTAVFVSAATAAGTATGTLKCPFPTIAQGLAAAQGTSTTQATVHVLPGTYKESDLSVASFVSLAGAGAATTTVQGNSTKTCSAGTSLPCAISVARDTALSGLTVTYAAVAGAPMGDAIVGPGYVANTTAPNISDVTVTNPSGRGVVALGGMDLGPGFSAVTNALDGVWFDGVGELHVHAAAGGADVNHFDDNKGHGIEVVGSGYLVFDGGTVVGNGADGIRLASGATATHVIKGLTAMGNANYGVTAYATPTVQMLTLRSSTLLGNANAGLYFDYGMAPTAAGTPDPLDIGGTLGDGGSDLGDNTFGPLMMGPGGAGVFLCNLGSTQPALGNTFVTCPPSVASLAKCTTNSTAPAAYTDVAYSPRTAGTILVPPVTPSTPLGACTQGP